ncbi:MAG TPA: hypothetical protein VIP10_07550 [Burkholderiaceae bacterium]
MTAKLVGSRAGSSMTGVTNTVCTYRYNDARGSHDVDRFHGKDATCPPTISVKR